MIVKEKLAYSSASSSFSGIISSEKFLLLLPIIKSCLFCHKWNQLGKDLFLGLTITITNVFKVGVN